MPVTEGDPFPTPRAWHAVASFIDKNKNQNTIILTGGLEFDQEKDVWKENPLSELYSMSSVWLRITQSQIARKKLLTLVVTFLLVTIL